VLGFVMLLCMDSSNKVKIEEIIKKPITKIVGGLVILLLIFMLFFGGGGKSSADSLAVSLKDLANQHQATELLVEEPASNVKSGKLKANLSQILLILAADRSELNTYYEENVQTEKGVASSVSQEPNEELKERIETAKIQNNLNPELSRVLQEQLSEIINSIQKIKKEYPEDKKLMGLMDKFILNTQTMQKYLSEGY
jgi:uncharacterized coiled-coil DUF342 family protein